MLASRRRRATQGLRLGTTIPAPPRRRSTSSPSTSSPSTSSPSTSSKRSLSMSCRCPGSRQLTFRSPGSRNQDCLQRGRRWPSSGRLSSLACPRTLADRKALARLTTRASVITQLSPITLTTQLSPITLTTLFSRITPITQLSPIIRASLATLARRWSPVNWMGSSLNQTTPAFSKVPSAPATLAAPTAPGYPDGPAYPGGPAYLAGSVFPAGGGYSGAAG